MATQRPFLTAAWRHLAMLNYEVPRHLLEPLVPAGTELDEFAGATLGTIVGFRFLETRVLGVPVPGHRDFDEVNLRFYVRRRTEDGAWRRARGRRGTGAGGVPVAGRRPLAPARSPHRRSPCPAAAGIGS